MIELLIVVAIIGILAGIGVPMYNGYMASARVQSTTTNHNNIVSFVTATLTRCAAGATTVTLGSTRRNCSDNSSDWSNHFRTYFNSISKNPYGENPYSGWIMATPSGGPRLGQTAITAPSGSKWIYIRTNIGTESGQSAFLPVPGGPGKMWVKISRE